MLSGCGCQEFPRAYLRILCGMGCVPPGASEAHIDSLLAAAEDFHRRVSVLDRQT